ncbi:MAG: hypothetical protein AAFV53_20955 [Myxococcota bacterium]
MLLLSSLLVSCATRSTTLSVPVDARDDGLTAELVIDGPLPARIRSGDEADLIVMYGGEEQGSLGPCGCPPRPRGGLARFMAYARTTADANPDATTMIVNGGYWLQDAVGLDGQLAPTTPIKNAWMMVGQLTLGADALNVGYNDLIGLSSLPEGTDRSELPLVSLNLSGPDIQPHRVLRRGDLRVAITGISTAGSVSVPLPDGFSTKPPVSARAALETLRQEVDLIILLAYHAPEAARDFAQDGLVDVVIDTHNHTQRSVPFRVGSALWVRSAHQSLRLGELRMGLDDDGAVLWAMDRKIDLDPTLPSDRTMMGVLRAAEVELSGR